MDQLILAINPGSTSTKLGVYSRTGTIFEDTVRHTAKALDAFDTVMAQYGFRLGLVMERMNAHGLTAGDLVAVVGRGGLLKAMPGGTYPVNEAMLHDLRTGIGGEHPCNLAGIIAHTIAGAAGISAYIVDPPVVDEMEDIARLSGLPEIARESRLHTLNQRAAGHKAAGRLGLKYADCNMVIAHMGGGISVTAHRRGRAVDTNNGVDSEGSYTPERSGTLPVRSLMRMCFSGEYGFEDMKRRTVGDGGLTAYLGTNDAREIVARIRSGDEYAKLVYEGMGYQIAKEIGAYAAVLSGQVDAVCLTGGLAHDTYLTEYITGMVRFIAPVMVFPGEDEQRALVDGVFRVLDGAEQPKEYA